MTKENEQNTKNIKRDEVEHTVKSNEQSTSTLIGERKKGKVSAVGKMASKTVESDKLATNKISSGNKSQNAENVRKSAKEAILGNSPKTQKEKNKMGNEESQAKVDEGSTEKKEPLAVEEIETDYFKQRENIEKRQQQLQANVADTFQARWHEIFMDLDASEEILELKHNEQLELYKICESAFKAHLLKTKQQRSSDDSWLHTALHNGTAMDRANAGATLIASNPLNSLDALSVLVSLTKPMNKCSPTVTQTLLDLWKDILLPQSRPLISLLNRGADWVALQADTAMANERKKTIYAFWYFEDQLKNQYSDYLNNMRANLQSGKEHIKNICIVAASKLLTYAPEKEQMLLCMLINKLGDPDPAIASKALYHLTSVAYNHPNMCGVIVVEVEKLLFRRNISLIAQHFALSFYAEIAPWANAEVCSKMVTICFAFFKILVRDGAVNTRIMQALLRCLQKSIVSAVPVAGETEILTKDMQDTLYRLVHLSSIRVSVQTLSLLLQVAKIETEKRDRFYMALYKKLMCIGDLTTNVKVVPQLLHIVHNAMDMDPNLARVMAFIKRIMQISLHMPPNITTGCLVVINKLICTRKELNVQLMNPTSSDQATPEVQKADNFNKGNNEKQRKDVRSENTKKYDPYMRVPAFAGAQGSLTAELIPLVKHYHPTVRLCTEKILNRLPLSYYGDPLRDFSVAHFLERFAFKNPKKTNKEKPAPVSHQKYILTGTRGQPVQTLTVANCTEDEQYIANYLSQKSNQSKLINKNSSDNESDEIHEHKTEVTDAEFDNYIGNYFCNMMKTAKTEAEKINFAVGLNNSTIQDTKANMKDVVKDYESDEDSVDWSVNSIEDDDDYKAHAIGYEDRYKDTDEDENENEDVDEDDDEDDDGDVDDVGVDVPMNADDTSEFPSDYYVSSSSSVEDDEDMRPPMAKKKRSEGAFGKGFNKKLKKTGDVSALFASTDELDGLLMNAGKEKGQGTANALFNRDKSTKAQLQWEEKRRSKAKKDRKKN